VALLRTATDANTFLPERYLYDSMISLATSTGKLLSMIRAFAFEEIS
jgi:hypothetical protein